MRIRSLVLIPAITVAACLDDHNRGAAVPDSRDEVADEVGADDEVTVMRDANQGMVDIMVNTDSQHAVSEVCFTLAVENGLGQLVMLAEGLCSSEYGTGAGGDIAYLASCDSGEPRTTVRAWVDSITTEDPNVRLANPCPGAGHDPSKACTLEVTCVENDDVTVEFFLTLAE